jgi:hypothetical protein
MALRKVDIALPKLVISVDEVMQKEPRAWRILFDTKDLVAANRVRLWVADDATAGEVTAGRRRSGYFNLVGVFLDDQTGTTLMVLESDEFQSLKAEQKENDGDH